MGAKTSVTFIFVLSIFAPESPGASEQPVEFNAVYSSTSVKTAIEILISEFEATFCGPTPEYQS